MGTLTQLIAEVNAGNREARDELFAAAYSDLRRLAHARIRERGSVAMLETTALVHESYLKFINSGQLRAEDQQSFFGYASKIMRSIIIDAVRERRTQRRGSGVAELTLDTAISESVPSGEAEILKVHEALLALEDAEPRLARVVEMRYFGGFDETEIADALGVTDRTVRRDWEKARLLLLRLMES
jgi:RNA polymerase sigma factor (TIGR02999 family)